MALKDEWKKTGKSFGTAFKGVGVSAVKSAKVAVDTLDSDTQTPQSNVFNDGTWRQTGKNVGGAFVNLGKSVIKSAKTGVDKLDEKIDK